MNEFVPGYEAIRSTASRRRKARRGEIVEKLNAAINAA